MTYGPQASHFAGQMPERAKPAMFIQDGASDSFDSDEPTKERNSRWPAWWPIARPHWPR
jgi:hypothetical protein